MTEQLTPEEQKVFDSLDPEIQKIAGDDIGKQRGLVALHLYGMQQREVLDLIADGAYVVEPRGQGSGGKPDPTDTDPAPPGGTLSGRPVPRVVNAEPARLLKEAIQR